MNSKVSVLYRNVWPDVCDKFPLANYLSLSFNKRNEKVQRAATNANRTAEPCKKSFRNI
jgi:hypothetical protein